MTKKEIELFHNHFIIMESELAIIIHHLSNPDSASPNPSVIKVTENVNSELHYNDIRYSEIMSTKED